MNEHFSEDIQGNGEKIPQRGMARSGIAFPYVSLEDAIVVTRAIHDNGAALSRDQIAGFLRLKSAHLRILAAKLFGLIVETPDGKLALSDLGVSILSTDENEAKAARRDAFLKVPLYQKTYDAFKNRNLPLRPVGLENAFVEFGVAPKQKDKARQAFDRSANFAGFFETNKDRLVEPIIFTKSPVYGEELRAALKSTFTESGGLEKPKKETSTDPLKEPLIIGLLERLPAVGSNWPLKDRVKWMKTLISNFTACYSDDIARDRFEIEVRIAKSEWSDEPTE